MSPAQLNESVIEEAALAWLEGLGWMRAHGPDIAPDMPAAERNSFGDVVFEGRLRDALTRLNPNLPSDAVEDAYRRLLRAPGSTLEARNRAFHRMLVDGVTVEYRADDGGIRGAQARVLDFDTPDENDWLAVNQFTVIENNHNRRPDVVLFVNGLPLGVIELKNAADEDATIWTAFNQLQTYKSELDSLFVMNELLVVSDGIEARVGTLTADKEWFKPWRTVEGGRVADSSIPELQVMIEGLCERQRCLDLIRDFIVFEDDGSENLIKKMAGYHQFHAVRIAIDETIRASEASKDSSVAREDSGGYKSEKQPGGAVGDQRIGVVWHTQGSGKSLTMAFYAGRIVREPAMKNPTLVVMTDRNDLDDQLYGTFAKCHELLRQPPEQAENREDLRGKLQVESGGVVFTTLQKFFPEEKGDRHPILSERRNIVVMADEAHRSQYDFIDGFARHMRDALPNASFIGFTGTPIELADANTRSVFGDYISVYDIQRAVDDESTVPIYYESRLAKLELDESAKPTIDAEFEEITEDEETSKKEKLKSKWAAVEALVGTDMRLRLIARDIVEHYGLRCETLNGKAMIVCMSRRICVELYEKIVALNPEWHHEDDEQGEIKIIMTGSASDPVEWQQHIRSKKARDRLAKRYRKPEDPFKIVIVRDMWLTGFDAPSMHTMYVDKPMRGHGLMQAIARVNRVYKDKPAGLIVDYIGLAHELKKALANYTESGGTGCTAIDQKEAIAVMLEKYEVCRDLFHDFDWSPWTQGNAPDKLSIVGSGAEFVKGLVNGKERCLQVVGELTRAFALARASEQGTAILDDVAFFQAVRSVLAKKTLDGKKSNEELDLAVRQIVSKAVAPDGVVDIFAAAGLRKPEVSILSEEFLQEIQGMTRRNLAVEMLEKLLKSEIRGRRRRNVVQARTFSEMLEHSLRRYQNRAVEAAQVIEELIQLAKEMRAAEERGDALGLNDDELAFYDALETNDSAVAVLGDATLRDIARELVEVVRSNVTIDWTVRENVRAQLRVIVKRILRKYGYPPDKQEKATATVMEQAEVLSGEWAVL